MFLKKLGLFLASLMVGAEIAVSVCPSTAVFDTNGTCYWRSTEKAKWIDALNTCLTMGARLVQVDSQAKSDFIYYNIPGNNWIALNDQANESYFEFPDGTLAGINLTSSSGGYLNWASGQPNEGSAQQCVGQNMNGMWHDRKCTDTNNYICETPAGTVQGPPADIRQACFGLLDKHHLTDTDNLMDEIPVTDDLECPLLCLQVVTCKGYYLYTPPGSTDKSCRLVHYIRGATGTKISTEMWVTETRL